MNKITQMRLGSIELGDGSNVIVLVIIGLVLYSIAVYRASLFDTMIIAGSEISLTLAYIISLNRIKSAIETHYVLTSPSQ